MLYLITIMSLSGLKKAPWKYSTANESDVTPRGTLKSHSISLKLTEIALLQSKKLYIIST